ncbi:MAG: glycosyltransferase family 9 protein [Vampirovibrionales bacterium]
MLPKEPKRILIVRLSANGDIVQSFDTLKRLRQRFPNAFIGWAVGEAGASLLKPVMPWLNAVHILPNKAWSKAWVWELLHLNKLGHVDGKVHHTLNEIHAQHYDVAIDVQGLNKSAVLPFTVGIAHRVGFANAREQARLFYTHMPARLGGFFQPTQHATKEFLSLLAPWNDALETPLNELAPLEWKPPLPKTPLFNALDEAHAEGTSLIGLAPFTMWASKHWGLAHWQGLIEALFEKHPQALGVCIGSPAELEKWQVLTQGLSSEAQGRLIHLEGQTTLLQLMHVLKKIDVLVGSDSAPLHLMDWLIREGVHPAGKVISLLGPTHPLRTGGASVNAVNLHVDLPCMPCHKRVCPLGTNACMTTLSVESVLSHL